MSARTIGDRPPSRTWCVGVYALGFGATMIAFALRVRALDSQRRDDEPGAAAA